MFDHVLSENGLAFREEVRDFVRSVPRQLILDMDQDRIRFPKEFLQEAGKRNLMGCRYPASCGGRDMDWLTTTMVMEEVGTLGYIFACVFGVGAELVCDAIIQHGTQEQIETYVKPLLRGQRFAAECLTEPRGGSDFFGTATTARDMGDHFVLNGNKRFIVGAEGADFFLVYARTDTDAPSHQALTCFIVDRSEGVHTDYLYGLMGCRGGGTGRLRFKDVRVPRSAVLGEVNGAYAVFNTMMVPERLGTAAMTIGATRPALDIATRYTMKRKAFGTRINNFQGVSFQVSDAAILLDACRSVITTTALAVDRKVPSRKVRRMISGAKKFVAESCQRVVHNAMQVMGGIGYTNVYPVERIYRDIRLASIWTGTNEIMSSIVASEWYREMGTTPSHSGFRDSELDAEAALDVEEKHFE